MKVVHALNLQNKFPAGWPESKTKQKGKITADKITKNKKAKTEKSEPVEKPIPQELPGVVGKGVEIVKIPELDKAIRKWEKHKDARCAETPNEVAAKKDVIAEFHKHEEKLPKDSEGNLIYRMDDDMYIIKRGKETLKKESAESIDED